MYGGTGPDVYVMKPNTDFVTVPRCGDFKTSIEIPPLCVLKIDSYVKEGSLEIKVSSTCDNSLFAKVEIEKMLYDNTNGSPRRYVLKVPADAYSKNVTICWTNSNFWGNRMLLYSLDILQSTVEDSNGCKEKLSPSQKTNN